MGIIVLKDHTSCQMFLPLPANRLMQSAQHATAYVRIHFWISKYEYNSDDSFSIEYRCLSLPSYWHTLHFVAVNEDEYVHCTTAHFDYNGKPLSQNVTTDSGIPFAPPLSG